MYVYNITIKVEKEILADWLLWQKDEHIPEIMSTQLFADFKFYKLLEQEEGDGFTYVVQYFTNSINNYEEYLRDYAPALREKANKRWGNKFIGFRSLMQAVQ